MVADVPVGVFLSGGIDSSLLAALLQKGRKTDPIHTFTIGFNESGSDESVSRWPRRVAEHLGTIHTERILSPDMAKKILPEWAGLYDEPFADSSGIATFLVSRMAAEKVKVVLSADGGDELFSGYGVYDDILKHWHNRNRVPEPIRYVVSTFLKAMPLRKFDSIADALPMSPSTYSLFKDKTTWKARRILDWSDASAGIFYERIMAYCQPEEISRFWVGTKRYDPIQMFILASWRNSYAGSPQLSTWRHTHQG